MLPSAREPTSRTRLTRGCRATASIARSPIVTHAACPDRERICTFRCAVPGLGTACRLAAHPNRCYAPGPCAQHPEEAVRGADDRAGPPPTSPSALPGWATVGAHHHGHVDNFEPDSVHDAVRIPATQDQNVVRTCPPPPPLGIARSATASSSALGLGSAARGRASDRCLLGYSRGQAGRGGWSLPIVLSDPCRAVVPRRSRISFSRGPRGASSAHFGLGSAARGQASDRCLLGCSRGQAVGEDVPGVSLFDPCRAAVPRPSRIRFSRGWRGILRHT